jgi:hypothetical protein
VEGVGQHHQVEGARRQPGRLGGGVDRDHAGRGRRAEAREHGLGRLDGVDPEPRRGQRRGEEPGPGAEVGGPRARASRQRHQPRHQRPGIGRPGGVVPGQPVEDPAAILVGGDPAARHPDTLPPPWPAAANPLRRARGNLSSRMVPMEIPERAGRALVVTRGAMPAARLGRGLERPGGRIVSGEPGAARRP